MYLLRAKKKFEEKDTQELQQKKENFELKQQKLRRIQAGRRTSSILFKNTDKNETLEHNKLPSRSTFTTNLVCEPGSEIRPAGFIGTFSVDSNVQTERVEIVRRELSKMQKSDHHKKVLIIISQSGLKVYSHEGSDLLMSHNLSNISYTTSDPEHCLFAFLAREPNSKVHVQFCHVFLTSTPQKAQDLGLLLGQAFGGSQNTSGINKMSTHLKQQFDEQKSAFTNFKRLSVSEYLKRNSIDGQIKQNVKSFGSKDMGLSRNSTFDSCMNLTTQTKNIKPFTSKGGFMRNK